ncbi:S ribonuclease [Pyrus ussuriensis x Pyrus communis]|uniref:S ribonuclease n=1 Tax=Pyrus ussuriensis x Pyrus communis TaxID=2448454 RepID=A0A5N5EYF7_9ROSA|nr:S ribonuclease [Pyrus ussuriensis x Pyrus communis]KAB2595524.1 S ribonuclease [Pyrus ussuriensis x Pyrus communis]
MREPVTPYAHTNFKLHKLKCTTLKIEVKDLSNTQGHIQHFGPFLQLPQTCELIFIYFILFFLSFHNFFFSFSFSTRLLLNWAAGFFWSPPNQAANESTHWGRRKIEYFERLCWECALRGEEELGIFFSSDTGAPRQGNVWRPSFLSSNGPLTGEDSVMQDATTATIVARNLLTPKDSQLLSGRSDELAVQESLALSVQCAGSVSNMGQRLLARSRQVESLMAERKLDEMQESQGRMQSDRQRLASFFQRHLFPGSSSVPPSIEAWNALSPMPLAPMPPAPMPLAPMPLAPMPFAPMTSAPTPSAPRVLPRSGASRKQKQPL